MHRVRPVLSLLLLAAVLGTLVWAQRSPEYLTIEIKSTPHGAVIEVDGEPIPWSNLRQRVTSRLERNLVLLPTGPPQIRIRIDDQQDWASVQPVLTAAACLRPDVELVLVSSLEGEITAGKGITLYTAGPSQGPGLLDDLELGLAQRPAVVRDVGVTLRWSSRGGGSTRILLGRESDLGSGKQGRRVFSQELQKIAGSILNQRGLTRLVLYPDPGVPFGEIHTALQIARGHRDEAGEWIPLIENVALAGVYNNGHIVQ